MPHGVWKQPKVELLIKQIMKAKGITVEALAQRLGLTKGTLSVKLRGNITLNALYDIAQALDCEIADLFPVPNGYRHWMECGEEAKAEGVELYCPKCGTKFTVGE